MLRELTMEEIGFVSGGWAPAGEDGMPGYGDELADQLASARESMLAAWGIETFGDFVDTDGDGAGDTIVVTANGTQSLPGDYYARYDANAKAWMIWEDDVFFDDFMGWFKIGTPQNHTLVTTDSEWSITGGYGPATTTTSTSGGGAAYWIQIPPPAN